MNRSVFSIVLVALIGRSSVAEIVMKTSEPKYVTDLYDAAIDVSMTCHEDPGDTVGIVGDSDGLALEALRSKYLVPVLLLNEKFDPAIEPAREHPIRSFIIVTLPGSETDRCMSTIYRSNWWNQFANFVFVNPDFDDPEKLVSSVFYMYEQTVYGLLNAQYICHYRRSDSTVLFNSNQFTRHAPPEWTYYRSVTLPGVERPLSIFVRRYVKGGRACEALNFPKTFDIGGWPIRFVAVSPFDSVDVDRPMPRNTGRALFEAIDRERQWFVDGVLKTLNATATVVDPSRMNECYEGSDINVMGIGSAAMPLSYTVRETGVTRCLILPMSEMPMFALTRHTGHKSQLEKILTVIDGESRIGVCAVYLVTFLFFTLFLRQAATQALLNLTRLTCNTGLPNLPNDLAPSVYLACLLMFVVTLQGIYTGNLATLLTTTIAYRNVQTRMDIASLGYTVYTKHDMNAKLAADPDLDGRVVEIVGNETCIDHVTRDSSAACVLDESFSLMLALENNLHISRDPIVQEFVTFLTTGLNPLAPRLDTVLKRWVEHGLWYTDPVFEKVRLMCVDDDEVKKNTERRVMNFSDLRFAFVILGLGLLCGFVCFVGEIVVCKIRSRMAERRERVRARLAWGVKKNCFSSFRSLNFRFDARRLFSRRRWTNKTSQSRRFVSER